ncbi:MAG: KR domain-containing protein, partial [bacterium]|nr:KR domain-containing protein [bacterium]
MTNNNKNDHETGLEVAVIGMAGRYPGAANLEEFWDNLKNGKETTTFFTDEELEEAGIDERMFNHPNYVKANGILDNFQYFDAGFFGFTPTEARLMDPQTRLFLECAWTALEDAAYVPDEYDGIIGMYSGAKIAMDWQFKTMLDPGEEHVDPMTMGFLTSKDYLSLRVSYALNLKGPSFTFFTACSTSLVAIHLGCQAVLSGECDIALAGGVSVSLYKKSGYMFQEEMVYSPDGHTRTFDAKGHGMLDANGVGIVVLKPLEEAISDGDSIYAVVKGTGINNDGTRKIGFTAPSIKGQEALLKDVYSAAEIDTESITYVECHGTATPLGDPVEVEALRRAFDTDKRHYCGLGSLKTNFGHSDCAAGVGGFIKVALSLYHRSLVPSLHFETPNPKIDFENSPFYVNTTYKEWVNDDYPLRGAVSALGIGGTNAHAILQEAPPTSVIETTPPQRKYKLFPLSAKTATTLTNRISQLAEYLENNPDTPLEDIAYTLQKGRAPMSHRHAFVAADKEELGKLLAAPDTAPLQPFVAGEFERPLVFMFSGQGSQYINMGLDLYKNEADFKNNMDECFDFLSTIVDEDLKPILYPQNEAEYKDAEEKINQLYYTQPLKFSFEYAYAKLLMSWGLVPHAMIGYSFGEYVVACLSEVFTKEEALTLLMARGRILEEVPPGLTITVNLPEEELLPMLGKDLYLAGVNTEELCLVGGTVEAVEEFETMLEKKEIDTMRLRLTCAAHCPIMEPFMPELLEKAKAVTFNKPKIPFVSGLTGTWMSMEDINSPDYWTRQTTTTVRFADALKTLFKTPRSIFIEVGPGKGMVNFANSYKDNGMQPNILALPMVRHQKDPVSDDYHLMNRVGQLFSYGKKIDWETVYGEEKRKRLRLPTYPFDSQYYWIDVEPQKVIAELFAAQAGGKKPDMKDWFYIPFWKTTLPTPYDEPIETSWKPGTCLVFAEESGMGEQMALTIEQMGGNAIIVFKGETFEKAGPARFRLNPDQDDHYTKLVEELDNDANIPSSIFHTWMLCDKKEGEGSLEWNNSIQSCGYFSLLNIARALGRAGIESAIQMEVLTDGLQSTAGEAVLYPEKATVMGPIKNIPQEYPNIKCRTVDIVQPSDEMQGQILLRQLLNEFRTPQTTNQVVAIRGPRRMVQDYTPSPIPHTKQSPPSFRKGGVFLITGGLGGVGIALGTHLVKTLKAKLVLTSRNGLPPKTQWDAYLAKAEAKDKKAQNMRDIMEMEKMGAEVMVAAVDIADKAAMKAVIDEVKERFGAIHGVIQSAYVADGKVIDQRDREVCGKTFAPKIDGTLILDELLASEPLDFFMLCSSTAALFGPVGQVAYTAANSFQDAFAHSRTWRTHQLTISINWWGWSETGGALDSLEKLGLDSEEAREGGLLTAEGVEAFLRIMHAATQQVVISPIALSNLFVHLNTARTSGLQEILGDKEEEEMNLLKRPQLSSEYVAPKNDIEESIASIWRSLFSLETVGVQDSFFELGGDSLKAMTVTSKIHKELKVKIPIATFFASPTIEELSVYIEDHKKEEVHAGIPKAPEKEYYPLSPVQIPIYMQQHKNPDSTYLITPICLGLPGPQDVGALEATLKTMIARNDSYQASFHLVDGQPMQKFHKDVDFSIQSVEFPGDPANYDELQEFMEARLTPFDMEKAPLLQAVLVKVDEENSVLVTGTHQLLLDGTSAGLFFAEVMNTFIGNELNPITTEYKDYSQWYHDRLESGQLKQSEDYWLEQFNTPVPRLNLPLDFPRPAARDFKGLPMSFEVEMELLEKLRDLTKDTGTTMFMLFMAAYQTLLFCYTGQEDITVGSRLASRLHTDLEKLIGKFSNTLGIRSYPQKEKSFREFLLEMKEISLGAYKHQEYPFEHLLDRLEYERDEARNPFFDTVFVYNNMINTTAAESPEGPGLSMVEFRHIKVPYDLLFQPNEIADKTIVLLHYPVALFKAETIKGLISDFLAILERICADPDVKLEAL